MFRSLNRKGQRTRRQQVSLITITTSTFERLSQKSRFVLLLRREYSANDVDSKEVFFSYVQQTSGNLLLKPHLRCELLIVCATHGGDNEATNQKHNLIKGEHDNDNYD